MYAGAMVVFIGLAAFLHLRFGLRRSTLWLLAVWGLLHMAGGTVAIPAEWADAGGSVLYSLRLHPLTPRYDQVVHAFGFFAASLACFDVLSRLVRHDAGQPRVGLAVASALLGCGLGAERGAGVCDHAHGARSQCGRVRQHGLGSGVEPDRGLRGGCSDCRASALSGE
ncbi:MAG: hypothetical protein ACFHWZ_03645 [Phycisphaerales bacterium]